MLQRAAPLRILRSVRIDFCACLWAQLVHQVASLPLAPLPHSFSLQLTRWRCLVGACAWDFARAVATWSALFAVLVVCDVGCFSCLHGTGRSFCVLRQRARQRRPPATPASDARQRRLPAGHTKPPLDSKPAGYARSRSLMPPVTTTARQGCVYRETQRKRTFRCVRRRSSCLATHRVSHGTSFLAPGSLARRRLARVIHHHHHHRPCLATCYLEISPEEGAHRRRE